jgi:type III secretion system YscD/HrpQ family protein
MADGKSNDRILLKILSGVQAGAEVALAPGEYVFGSGAEDDLQFVDASLKSAHARLRLAPGKLEIKGGQGAISTATGARSAADSDDWQELEPLEIVTAGTVRFALGPTTAQWTTLADASAAEATETKPASSRRAAAGDRSIAPALSRQLAWPVAVVAVAVAFVIYLTHGTSSNQIAAAAGNHTDIEAVREALDQFPFGKSLEVRREVDGTLFVTGFVESPVERRAITGAVEKLGVQPRMRLGVLQSLRAEMDGMIKAERVAVTYQISTAGDLTLDGVILNKDQMQKFVDRVQGTVVGLHQVDNRIRTAPLLLGEIEKLSKLSQIDGFVVFRLDGELVEVNGILPTAKIDAWVGFLQAYSRRFAKDIGLRSLVRLQNPDGSPAGDAPTDQGIVIGGKPTGAGDIVLDVEKLKLGQYDAGDMFVSGRNKPAKPVRAAANGPGQPPGQNLVQVQAPPAGPAAVGPRKADAPAAEPADLSKLTRRADDLIKTWQTSQKGGAAPAGADSSLVNAINSLLNARMRLEGTTDTKAVPSERFMPLLGSDLAYQPRADACRPGSRLTTGNIRTVLFWLDLLSMTSSMSIKDFELEEQGAILEAALVPTLAGACMKTSSGRDYAAPSLYLAEAARNPDFASFLTRDLQPFALDIGGANLGGDRYIQIRDGSRFGEGAAPDGTSRIALVGELGVLVRRSTGFATVLYGQSLNWVLR